MKDIDLNQLETTTGGHAPVPFYPPPYAPHWLPPSPAAAWRWAAQAQYRAAAAYYGYGGFVPSARRWWW